MREITGVDHERIEHLYLAVSAKAKLVIIESILRDAVCDLEIAGIIKEKDPEVQKARATIGKLREKTFAAIEKMP